MSSCARAKRNKWRRRLLWTLLGLFTGGAIPMLFGCYWLSVPPYEGPKSAHFNGKFFFNPWSARDPVAKSRREIWKWSRTRKPAPWPAWIETPPGPPPPARIAPGSGKVRATFINHSTVLLQMEGINLLTDPIWSARCSPVPWAGPKRVHAPGIRFEDLPPIDAILLTHNHYDHMDLPTLRRLMRVHGNPPPPIFTGLGNSAFLEKKGIKGARDLDWWDSVELRSSSSPPSSSQEPTRRDAPAADSNSNAPSTGTVRITYVPAQHFSARGLNDRNAALWGGFVVEAFPSRHDAASSSSYSTRLAVYFAGDTGFAPHFEEIARRFGPFRLAMLPIGAYDPAWFMQPGHINPEEAVRAHQILGAQHSLAIHWGTFQLTDEPREEPVERLARALQSSGIPAERFRALAPGEWIEP